MLPRLLRRIWREKPIRLPFLTLLGVRTLGPESDPYLIRNRVFSSHWLRTFVHIVVRSDQDREFHDHPWWFFSIVLWGGYTEHTPRGSRWYGPGSVIFHRATDLHRLEVKGPTVTLVVAGREKRNWGFQTDRGWMRWQDFLAHPDSDQPRTAPQ